MPCTPFRLPDGTKSMPHTATTHIQTMRITIRAGSGVPGAPEPMHMWSYQWMDLNTPRHKRPVEFVAASKFGEVPALVDGGTALCLSNATLMHLAQRTNVFRGEEPEWQTILEWLLWETNRIGFSIPNLHSWSLE